MKIILGAFILLTLFSCKQEEIASYDDLTAEEREAIRTRSRTKCISESEKNFLSFKNTSNEKLLNLDRGDYWKIELTGGSASEVSYIYIWKRSGNNVYFLHQKGTTSAEYTFIKIPSSFNGDMVDDLLDKKCDKVYSITNSSSSISIKFTDISQPEPPDYYKSDYTYTSTSSYPTFLLKYLYTQTKKKLKESGSSTVVSTTTYTSKITTTGSDYDLEASYTAYGSAQFCVFNYSDDGAEKDLTFPYSLVCSTNAATGPTNPGADANLNFVPSTEL